MPVKAMAEPAEEINMNAKNIMARYDCDGVFEVEDDDEDFDLNEDDYFDDDFN